jgi:hypothetical protein
VAVEAEDEHALDGVSYEHVPISAFNICDFVAIRIESQTHVGEFYSSVKAVIAASRQSENKVRDP